MAGSMAAARRGIAGAYVDPFIARRPRPYLSGRDDARWPGAASPDPASRAGTGAPAITTPTRKSPVQPHAPERHRNWRSLRHPRHATQAARKCPRRSRCRSRTRRRRRRRLLLRRPADVRHPCRTHRHRRVGLHRYSPSAAAGRQPAVSFDLGSPSRDEPVEAQLTLEGPTTISGYRFSKAGRRTARVLRGAVSTPFQTC